jgi:hypothetical protein
VSVRVRIRAGLAMGRLPAGHKLVPLLAAAALKAGVEVPRLAFPERAWDAGFFGLDRVAVYRTLAVSRRKDVLRHCAKSLLSESCHIERLGLAFTAKMSLLSRTEEERQLYALFAADEARHLREISHYLPDGPSAASENPFLLLLGEIIERGQKPGLTALIQVVLEGWGLTHYGSLARACRDEGLRRTLRRVLKDEALHHGSGVVLASSEPLSRSERREVEDWLLRLARMVQAGPQAVVGALGLLSRRERVKAFAELSCEAHSAERLALLRGLIASCGETRAIEMLEGAGALRPLDAASCARWS